jgi:hypothetical protein
MADRRSAQDTVCLAVGLGWLLAELYDSKRLPGPPPEDDERPLPPHLPGIGAMTPYEKACALAAHVGADLARLEASLGLGMPTAKSIQAVLDTPGHARDDVRRVVHDLYLDIRNRLLGRAVRQAEHAMWDAEVVAAIGKAATIIPDRG